MLWKDSERGAIKNTSLAHLTLQSAKLTVPFGWTTLVFVQDHNTYKINSFHSTALKHLNFQSQTGKIKIIRKKQRLFNFQSTDQALEKLTAASEPSQLLQDSMTVIPETLMKSVIFLNHYHCSFPLQVSIKQNTNLKALVVVHSSVVFIPNVYVLIGKVVAVSILCQLLTPTISQQLSERRVFFTRNCPCKPGTELFKIGTNNGIVSYLGPNKI